MLLVFCVMVHSGAAFKSDQVVNDILDSTTFNVAMFAMGWAVTNWAKTGSAQPKHWSKVLLSASSLALRAATSGIAIASSAVSPRQACSLKDVDVAAEPAKESLELLPEEGEECTPLVAALSAWIAAKLATHDESRSSTPPWRRHADRIFREDLELSPAQMSAFITHIFWYFECSSPCLVLAAIFLDRAAARDAAFELSALNCRRLLLTALVLALKFHDDDYCPYPNSFYAEMGDVTTEELKAMEKHLCKHLDWQFYVGPEEYQRYHQLLISDA